MSRVVVVGAGFAGWLAAIGLTSLYDEVVLLERDAGSRLRVPRRGVPQGGQLHNLLGRAQLHLEELAPGFLVALRDAGCGFGRVSIDTRVFELGVDMPRRPLDIEIYCAARPVIDGVLSDLAKGVTIREAAAATALMGTSELITGVRYDGPEGPTAIECDLVVDASGPSSLTARWLSELGLDVPTSTAQADQWYVSSIVELGSSDAEEFMMVFPDESSSRGALISPAGDGTYCLSVSGRSSDEVPKTFSDVLSFTSSLGANFVAHRLAGATLLSGPSVFRRLVATWRRFDQIEMPSGLVAIGDSVAALNPLFGQGMSVAAWQVSALRQCDRTRIDWQREFASVAAEAVAQAWSLGETVGEAVISVRDNGDPLDLTAALAAEIGDDPALHERYVRMWHLLEPASFLKSPEMTERLRRRAAKL